jgi:hypothetical protein
MLLGCPTQEVSGPKGREREPTNGPLERDVGQRVVAKKGLADDD